MGLSLRRILPGYIRFHIIFTILNLRFQLQNKMLPGKIKIFNFKFSEKNTYSSTPTWYQPFRILWTHTASWKKEKYSLLKEEKLPICCDQSVPCIYAEKVKVYLAYMNKWYLAYMQRRTISAETTRAITQTGSLAWQRFWGVGQLFHFDADDNLITNKSQPCHPHGSWWW